MEFDYGETLTQSVQITWKRKSLWGVMALPMLPLFVMLPLFFAAIPFLENSGNDLSGVSFLVLVLVFGVFFIVGLFITAYANSAATLGIIRTDRGDAFQFVDLLRDALPFYGRSLGLLLLLQLTIGLVFTIIFLFIALLTFVTMGIGSFCAQPIIMLLTPFSLLFVAFMESAQTALIAENLGVVDALKCAWEIVRRHVWKFVIITLVVYMGTSMLSGVVVFPLMVPMFFMAGFAQSVSQSITPMVVVMAVGMCIFFPVMLLLSSIIQVFMKASLDLTYLRLAASGQKTENQVIFSE